MNEQSTFTGAILSSSLEQWKADRDALDFQHLLIKAQSKMEAAVKYRHVSSTTIAFWYDDTEHTLAMRDRLIAYCKEQGMYTKLPATRSDDLISLHISLQPFPVPITCKAIIQKKFKAFMAWLSNLKTKKQ